MFWSPVHLHCCLTIISLVVIKNWKYINSLHLFLIYWYHHNYLFWHLIPCCWWFHQSSLFYLIKLLYGCSLIDKCYDVLVVLGAQNSPNYAACNRLISRLLLIGYTRCTVRLQNYGILHITMYNIFCDPDWYLTKNYIFA